MDESGVTPAMAAIERAEPLFAEGNRLMQAGDDAGAEACYRQVLALAPDFGEALANLGLLREKAGALDEAEACYRRALELCPTSARNCVNLGVLLTNVKRFAEADATFLRALTLDPESPAAWSDYGVLLACLKREAEAEQCYRTAMALDPAYDKARFNLGYVLLRQGRLEEGWACFEARDWYDILTRHFACPRWQGEPLAGKSVIIGFEAGHGDMIQFCRYARVLKEMGAVRIALVCHPALKNLFACLAEVDELFSFLEPIPISGWDLWSPPMSLPLYCGTGLANIPGPIPYLQADPARLAKWLPRLPQAGLRVGLVWKGNPRFENDADRSLPSLDVLAPLVAVAAAGISFVSLQKGRGEDEAANPPAGMSLLHLGGEMEDFADTAAVVSGLDLVISVDTAVAHLSGALGVPCWVLLPDYKTDWRWLTGRTDSPWYPGAVRLFRQPPGGGWGPVVADVVSALTQKVAQRLANRLTG
jgi:Tfp pilus assembly protein PilF